MTARRGKDDEKLQASVRSALACPDEAWYRRLLAQDASGCPLSADEIACVLAGAMAAAFDAASRIVLASPRVSPAELARTLQLEIVPMDDDTASGPLPMLGLYRPAQRQILLNEGALAAIEGLIANHGLETLTPGEDLKACVLYHEIFHALEEETPSIFTRSAMLERKLFGLIPRRRGLASASEIGAIHFSRLMAGTAYSPCIFGHYLLILEGRADLNGLPS
jgi:hypothetical protein